MSMTMMCSRLDGTIDKNKILRRFQNLLNLTYLQAEPLDEGGYRISEKLFEQIQTELDFNISADEVETRKLEEQIKKRYRQRNSYRFWKELLDIANISNDVDAKEYLMKIFSKLDNTRYFGSMTHSFYALETLQLAIDDTYGTNNIVLKQYKFTNPKASNKASKKKKLAKKARKSNKISTADVVPF